MAAGDKRHDPQGQPVNGTAEHVHHALLEVYPPQEGARLPRPGSKLELQSRMMSRVPRPGLTRAKLTRLVLSRRCCQRHPWKRLCRMVGPAPPRTKPLRAFEASGQTLEAFADIKWNGAPHRGQQLERARRRAGCCSCRFGWCLLCRRTSVVAAQPAQDLWGLAQRPPAFSRRHLLALVTSLSWALIVLRRVPVCALRVSATALPTGYRH